MSSIVGAIFMILIVGMLASAYFMFTLAQNTSYNDAIRSTNYAEVVRMSESIKVPTAATYTQSGSGLQVSVTLQNDGPIGVQIRTLWVSSSADDYGFSDLSIYLKPGESQLINQVVEDVAYSDNCYGWVVTDRGRTFELYPDHGIGPQGETGEIGPIGPTGPPGPTGPAGPQGETSTEATTALTSQGIGILSFDFDSITYFTVSNGVLSPYPNGIQSYTIPAVNNLAIGFNVTNQNPEYNYTLSDQTTMWSYFAAVPGHTLGPLWNLISNHTNTIDQTYIPVQLNYNVSKFIIFYQPNTNDASFDNAQQDSLAAINLLFWGDLTKTENGVTTAYSSYGQNVPFVTLYFRS